MKQAGGGGDQEETKSLSNLTETDLTNIGGDEGKDGDDDRAEKPSQ